MILGFDGRLANLPQRAGVGNFTRELLRALPGAQESGELRVYLDAPPREDFPLQESEVALRVLPKRRFWTQRILPVELRRNPPDVFLSPVMQFPFYCPCPGIATIPDLAAVAFGGCFTWRWRITARIQARQVVMQADHLIALSEATRKDIMRYYGVPAERITISGAGVSPDFHPVSDPQCLQAVRKQYGLPEHFILYVGRIQPRKNIGRLIQAFETLCMQYPDLPHHLVLAGDRGWMDGPIYETVRNSPEAARIHCTGFIVEADLTPLICAAAVLALVSLWEGFGLPVAEAMACGTAVITSDCSSLPDVAGDAALLVDPYDTGAITGALAQVLMDDELRCTLETKGLVRATEFTWEETARRVMNAVKKVYQECA